MKKIFDEFREFIASGNMIELAVAVILGASLSKLIDSFTNGVMMQFVSAIVGQPNFDELTFTIGDTPIYYGAVLTAFVSLLLTGAVLFFIVKAYNTMRDNPEVQEETPTEIDLLTDIRDELRSRQS